MSFTNTKRREGGLRFSHVFRFINLLIVQSKSPIRHMGALVSSVLYHKQIANQINCLIDQVHFQTQTQTKLCTNSAPFCFALLFSSLGILFRKFNLKKKTRP